MSHSEKIPTLSSLRYGSYLKTAGNFSPGLAPVGMKRSAARRTPSFIGIQTCSIFTSYKGGFAVWACVIVAASITITTTGKQYLAAHFQFQRKQDFSSA